MTALLKTLPKAIRRNVVPAGDWARRLIDAMPATDGGEPATEELEETGLTEYLAAAIQRLTFTPVTAEDFETDRLPAHLSDDLRGAGRPGRRGRALQGPGRPAAEAQDARSRGRRTGERGHPARHRTRGAHRLDFDELPRIIDTRQVGTVVRAYPALVDRGDSVSITLLSTPEDQARAMPDGVRRLLLLGIPSPLSYVREHLSQNEKLLLATSPYQNSQALFDDCLLACVDAGLRRRAPGGLIWTRDEFESTRLEVSTGLVDALYATVGTVSTILGNARDADRAIRDATSLALVPALADARQQLAGLVFPASSRAPESRSCATCRATSPPSRLASRSCRPSSRATAPG